MSNVLEYRKEQAVRSRSLYTAHSYQAQVDDPGYQGVFYDSGPNEAWVGGGGVLQNSVPPVAPVPVAPVPVAPYMAAASVWRHPRTAKLYPAMYYTAEESCMYTQQNGETEPVEQSLQAGAASATPHGTITLRLGHRIRVDFTIDKAVRIINFKNNIVMSMSSTGATCALLHPNGRVHQYGSRVEIMAYDSRGNHKFAKMWYKGISFTSENCALVYLVDSAGTRTTTDNFSDLNQDFSLGVFYNESRHGANFMGEAMGILQNSQYWISEDEVENWIVNNVRVTQASDGLVRVARNSNKYNMRTSPSNGTASMTTPFIHCTASMGQTSHLFVRRGERRLHYDGSSFIVRNAGHSAGFDERTQLKVF